VSEDWIHHHLNLSRPEQTTPAEIEAWREHELKSRGYPLPTWNMLLEFRPEAVKRWLVQQQSFAFEGSVTTVLAFVNYYAIIGFEAGEHYTIDIAERAGHSCGEIIDVLNLAFLESPSVGMHYLAPSVAERLRRYGDPVEPYPWPSEWSHDAGLLRSGIDFSDPEVLPGEVESLLAWFERVTGEVPAGVRFLARENPKLLKAQRGRLEHATSVLPTQMIPYLQIVLEGTRGSADGVREAMLLGRGLGMTRAQAVSSAMLSTFYAGPSALSLVERAAGDLLEGW
jgi:hypothetical protein